MSRALSIAIAFQAHGEGNARYRLESGGVDQFVKGILGQLRVLGFMSQVITGGCQCGEVRYEVRGKLRDVIACHCVQCRRTSGHFVAATACRRCSFALVKSATLKWYVAVPGYRRGFCGECGSSLFFEEVGGERVSIAAGSLDKPLGLRIAAHLFVGEAGDYYQIDPSVPISQRGDHDVPLP